MNKYMICYKCLFVYDKDNAGLKSVKGLKKPTALLSKMQMYGLYVMKISGGIGEHF